MLQLQKVTIKAEYNIYWLMEVSVYIHHNGSIENHIIVLYTIATTQ